MLKKLLIRKADGEATVVAAMVADMVAIVVFYLIVVMMIDYTKIVDTKNSICSVGDSYLQLMMTEGCLTQEDRQALEEDLAHFGVEGLDLTGTTMSQVDYGQRVHLEMKYSVDVTTHGITSLFTPEVHSKTLTGTYSRTATSFR